MFETMMSVSSMYIYVYIYIICLHIHLYGHDYNTDMILQLCLYTLGKQ